jgi:hypothetical protein
MEPVCGRWYFYTDRVGRSAIDRSPTDHAMLDSDGVELTMEARGDIERLAEGTVHADRPLWNWCGGPGQRGADLGRGNEDRGVRSGLLKVDDLRAHVRVYGRWWRNRLPARCR